MELRTKPYSKHQKKATPIFPPHRFEKSRSLSPATCGGGVATQKRPHVGACAQGGAWWRAQGLGRKHMEDSRCSKKQGRRWEDQNKQLGPAEPREALGAEGGQRFWDFFFFSLFDTP